MQEKEKKIICIHESGHALTAKKLPGGDPVHKVSIIPRGPALGYTMQLPVEDRYIALQDELLDKIKALLGGRVAEKIVFGHYSTGAQNDLEKATEIAHKMVTQFGMSQRIGPAVFNDSPDEVFLGMDISQRARSSEKTKQIVDEEVRNTILKAEKETAKILTENRKFLEKIAEELEKREILDGEDIDKIMQGVDLPPIDAPQINNAAKKEEDEKSEPEQKENHSSDEANN